MSDDKRNQRHFLTLIVLVILMAIPVFAVILIPMDNRIFDKGSNRYEPTPQELAWACNENREINRNREGYERVLIKCLSGVHPRYATGTDDQSDIVEECKIAASTVYRTSGFYTKQEQEALNRTYKDCNGESTAERNLAK